MRLLNEADDYLLMTRKKFNCCDVRLWCSPTHKKLLFNNLSSVADKGQVFFFPFPLAALYTNIRPPSAVIREDRAKATAVWTILLLGFIAYVIYLGLYSLESRENPPVKIQRKVCGIVCILYCCLSCLALGIWNASTQLSTNMPTINHFDRSWWIAHTSLLCGAMFGGGSLPCSISVGVFERIWLCVSVTCSFLGRMNQSYLGGAFQVTRCGALPRARRWMRLQRWNRLLADVVAALCTRGEYDQVPPP